MEPTNTSSEVGANIDRWGQQVSGALNLVRFLHLDNDQVVVGLPLHPDPDDSGPMTPTIMDHNIGRMASMIASMEYVATHTSTPASQYHASFIHAPIQNLATSDPLMSSCPR